MAEGAGLSLIAHKVAQTVTLLFWVLISKPVIT